jgi:hypothetical protein
MVEHYLPKKPKFTFCYSALKRQIFLTSKQGPGLLVELQSLTMMKDLHTAHTQTLAQHVICLRSTTLISLASLSGDPVTPRGQVPLLFF